MFRYIGFVGSCFNVVRQRSDFDGLDFGIAGVARHRFIILDGVVFVHLPSHYHYAVMSSPSRALKYVFPAFPSKLRSAFKRSALALKSHWLPYTMWKAYHTS